MIATLSTLQQRLAPGSVLIFQGEKAAMLERLPLREAWDERKYGRNHLLFWVKPMPAEPAQEPEAGNAAQAVAP
jgi:hypothetical protein